MEEEYFNQLGHFGAMQEVKRRGGGQLTGHSKYSFKYLVYFVLRFILGIYFLSPKGLMVSVFVLDLFPEFDSPLPPIWDLMVSGLPLVTSFSKYPSGATY